MKKLAVNLDEITTAFEYTSWETKHYLDLKTGQVMMVALDTYRELEQIYAEAYTPEAGASFDLAEILQQYDLPEWQKQALLEAYQIEANHARYLAIPQDVEQGLISLLT